MKQRVIIEFSASDRSIWEQDTGKPKGTFAQCPNSILLVAVPRRDVHPLQPFVIDEAALRQFLVDGKEILFITCDRERGNVRIQDGEVVYVFRHPT